MAGGGNFQGSQRRPGFTPGGPNDPASGGSGYTGGGWGNGSNMGSGGTGYDPNIYWGGNYGNQTGRRRPGFTPGGPGDPASGGSGYMGGSRGGPGEGDIVHSVMPYPGMPNGVGGYPSYDPGMFNPGVGYPDSGWGGGPDWNVQNPGMPGGGKYPKEGVAGDVAVPGVGISEAAPDPWAGISQGRLGQARRFANAGQFGRAKQQIGLGGGNWDDVGGLLRTEAAADDNYGGDWNWGGASDADVAQAQRFANAGMMGRAKGIMGDNWNKKMHTQFQAEGNANPYVKGESMGFDWGNVGDQRLAQSKALAQQGKFGQAKKMFTGGVAGKSQGTWDPNIARQMRAWHKGNQ